VKTTEGERCMPGSEKVTGRREKPEQRAGQGIPASQAARVLVVAHRTAATPRLLAAVGDRARRGPCVFTLLMPRPYWDPDTEETAAALELAIPLLEQAAGNHVEAIIGNGDPAVAVQSALQRARFDEAIVSTLPARVSHWLRRDLPHRIEQLGLPVTTITAEQAQRAVSASHQ